MRIGSSPRPSTALLLAAVAILAPTLMTAPALAGATEKTVDGVLHVVNDGGPSQGTQTWDLQEMWRAGGEDDEVLFGLVSAVDVDKEGNVYLLDSQLAEVKVYSPDGKFLRTLSREGEGPGETRNPNGMVVLPDGLIALGQAFPGKIVMVDKEGNPAGGFTLGASDPSQGGFVLMHGMRTGGDNLVFGHETISQSADQTKQTRTAAVVSYDREGKAKATYDEFSYEFDFTNFVLDDSAHLAYGTRRFTVGPDGRVYVAPERDRYAIKVFAPDGKLERVIERTLSPRRRTADEVANIRSFFEAATRQVPIEVKINIGDTEPPINWFMVSMKARPDGTLWVLGDAGSREQPQGIMQTYDVFDAKGQFARQVAMKCPGNPEQDALFFAGPDRLIMVTGFIDAVRAAMGGGGGGEQEGEAAPIQIVCYKVAGKS